MERRGAICWRSWLQAIRAGLSLSLSLSLSLYPWPAIVSRRRSRTRAPFLVLLGVVHDEQPRHAARAYLPMKPVSRYSKKKRKKKTEKKSQQYCGTPFRARAMNIRRWKLLSATSCDEEPR